jgi:hypothetical protein
MPDDFRLQQASCSSFEMWTGTWWQRAEGPFLPHLPGFA